MHNIWKDLPKPFFILAPMEGVTDVVFRHVVASAGRPDLFFTEFVNASSYCSEKGMPSTRGRLTFTPDEHPIIAQIWGKKPEEFKKMSLGLLRLGYKGIDINMGCPDKNVVRNGAGSGLIKNPELAAELIAAAKTAGLPVSVKTRLGDRKVEEWSEWIEHILRQDVDNLTIHLRTRKEMSKVPAHYELVGDIVKLRDRTAPKTLITINGDIRDRKHGEELAAKHGVDGIMIGRGIFANPFAFEIEATEHTKYDLIRLMNLHLDIHDYYSKQLEPRKYDPLKRFFKVYIRDFPGASEMRDELMHTENTSEARSIINGFQH